MARSKKRARATSSAVPGVEEVRRGAVADTTSSTPHHDDGAALEVGSWGHDLSDRILRAAGGNSKSDARLVLKLLSAGWKARRIDPRVMEYLAARIDAYLEACDAYEKMERAGKKDGTAPSLDVFLGLRRAKAGNPHSSNEEANRELRERIRAMLEEPAVDGYLPPEGAGWSTTWPREVAKYREKSDASIVEEFLSATPPSMRKWSPETVQRAVDNVRTAIAREAAQRELLGADTSPEDVERRARELRGGWRFRSG